MFRRKISVKSVYEMLIKVYPSSDCIPPEKNHNMLLKSNLKISYYFYLSTDLLNSTSEAIAAYF